MYLYLLLYSTQTISYYYCVNTVYLVVYGMKHTIGDAEFSCKEGSADFGNVIKHFVPAITIVRRR
jgi:hypothetical protein